VSDAGLRVEKLVKNYPTRGEPLEVLRGVDLSLNAGESAAIMGPSGCGKSTLLQVIGTLDRPTAGSVHVDGVDPFALPESELAAFRNERIGFVFQDHHLLPQCSAMENVLIPSLAGRGSSAELTARARSLLEQVGLASRADHRPAELSGGERQRVAIARALLLSPPLVLADEPTGNLDEDTADEVARMLIETTREQQVMLVVVTHSPALANQLGQTWRLHRGRIVEPAAVEGA
jgi:lipoprotein-releasing system ATP-binding protein